MNDSKGKIIYMDNAASVRLKNEALTAMMPYFADDFYNPGGAYSPAQEIKKAVAAAREDIAMTVNAAPTEIFFTSGGTESDNQALRSAAALRGTGHIIVSSFEHHAVLNTCKYLERQGIRVSYVNPTSEGLINVSDIKDQIREDTILISVMYVNNELGTIQPIREIAETAHDAGILFHTDAVAAMGHIPIDVRELKPDLMSAGAHKFGGPKGIGFQYVRENLKLLPLIYGGSQERGRRAGTENVPGIIGMAAALKVMNDDMDKNLARRRELDEYFVRKIEGETGNRPLFQRTGRIPGHFSLTLSGVNAEELVVRLGMKGICISTGAACSSSNDEVSHVLKAVGMKKDLLRSTIRISMNEDNTEEEIDSLLETIDTLSYKIGEIR